MSKNNKRIYKKDHTIAKLIVAIIVSILITLAQLSSMPINLILNILAIFIWFFGVNPIGYAIESLLNHKHKHDKL